MLFKSKTEKKIADARGRVDKLKLMLEKEKEAFIASKKAEGWKEFKFFSQYYGSHPEYGEGDERETYLFHPTVDFTRWENEHFSHGHGEYEEPYSYFQDWIEQLDEEKYILVSQETECVRT